MSAVTEPGLLVANILDEIIDRINKSQPVKTDGTGLTTGYVISRLPLAIMVAPEDFSNAWTPTGAGIKEVATAYVEKTPAPAAGAPASAVPDGTSPKFRRAFQAAFNTSLLVDTMIKLSANQSYIGYPTERHVSFDYEVVLGSMQADPAPPLPAETQARIDAAMKLLYKLDEDGAVVGKSANYKRYHDAANAYAMAKATFGRAFSASANTPDWPFISPPLQQAVDEAFDDWRLAGAEKIEAALATVESVGVPMQQKMQEQAIKLLDVYKINVTGLPARTAYSFVFPSTWADPDSDDSGWTRLKLESHDYHSHSESVGGSNYWQNWQSSGQSAGGGGAAMVFGFAFGGSAGHTSHESSADSGSNSWGSYRFQNSATDLSVDLEYGAVTIERPWLVSDLFYFDNWYTRGGRKGNVSNGTADPNTNSDRLLPMIPKQFLVIRNVKITSSNWGADGDFFHSAYQNASSQASGSGDHVSASAGLFLGPIAFGGHGEKSSFHEEGHASGQSGYHASDNYGWRYQGGELSIKGAQIVAWLSEIVPKSAPLDDKGLPPQA